MPAAERADAGQPLKPALRDAGADDVTGDEGQRCRQRCHADDLFRAMPPPPRLPITLSL